MSGRLKVATLAAVLFAISFFGSWSVPAHAQAVCPEGKTFGGECVNPALGAAMREQAIIFAHPKLSTTAYPVLPNGDRDYRYPNQLNPTFQPPSPTGTPGG